MTKQLSSRGPRSRRLAASGFMGIAALVALAANLVLPAWTSAGATAVTWAPVTAPTPVGTNNDRLNSVSCPVGPSKLCVAVGYAFGGRRWQHPG